MSKPTPILYRLDFQTFFESDPTDWITLEEVKKLSVQGRVKSDTLVLKKGTGHWVLACNLPEINDLVLARKKAAAKENKAMFLVLFKRTRETLSLAIRVISTSIELAATGVKFLVTGTTTQSWKNEPKQVVRHEAAGKEAKGYLYLVRLTYKGITYSKIGITKHSAETRYSGHEAAMAIVGEWELPSAKIARQIEQHILRKFGDFRAAAPEGMDGYTETFSIELEAELRAEAIHMVKKHSRPPERSGGDLAAALLASPSDREAIKTAIGKGGQRLRIEYWDKDKAKKTVFATVTRLNGRWIRVYDNHDPSNLEKSIVINKIIRAKPI